MAGDGFEPSLRHPDEHHPSGQGVAGPTPRRVAGGCVVPGPPGTGRWVRPAQAARGERRHPGRAVPRPRRRLVYGSLAARRAEDEHRLGRPVALVVSGAVVAWLALVGWCGRSSTPTSGDCHRSPPGWPARRRAAGQHGAVLGGAGPVLPHPDRGGKPAASEAHHGALRAAGAGGLGRRRLFSPWPRGCWRRCTARPPSATTVSSTGPSTSSPSPRRTSSTW